MILRGIVMILVGAVLGPLGDYLHVLATPTGAPLRVFHSGGEVLGVSLWSPALFALAALLVGLVHPLLDPLLGGKKSRPGARSWLGAASGLGIFLGLYAACGFVPLETGGWKDIVLGFASLSIWAIWDGTWQGLVLGGLTAAAGCAAELFLVEWRLFHYQPSDANVWGLPSWLPWLYLTASVALGNFGRRLKVAFTPPPPPPPSGATQTGRFSATTSRSGQTGRFPSRN